MLNKIISILLVFVFCCSFSLCAFADEAEATTSVVYEPTTLTQSDVPHQSDVPQSDDSLLGELERINKHLDFYTTFAALILVVFVIVVLWLVFGRWFFRY